MSERQQLELFGIGALFLAELPPTIAPHEVLQNQDLAAQAERAAIHAAADRRKEALEGEPVRLTGQGHLATEAVAQAFAAQAAATNFGLFSMTELPETELPEALREKLDQKAEQKRLRDKETREAKAEFQAQQLSLLARLDHMIEVAFPEMPVQPADEEDATAEGGSLEVILEDGTVRKVGYPKGRPQTRSSWVLAPEILAMFSPDYPTQVDVYELATRLLKESRKLIMTKDVQYARGRMEEIDWTFSDCQDGFSFHNCCLIVGVDPETARASYVHRRLVPSLKERALWYFDKRRKVLKEYSAYYDEKRRKVPTGYANMTVPSADVWEAFEWVCSRSREAFSFEDCALLVGFDPQDLRNGIIDECNFLDDGYAEFSRRQLHRFHQVLSGKQSADDWEKEEILDLVGDRRRRDILSFRALCKGAEVNEKVQRGELLALANPQSA
jgi:hypothetical protein